MPYSINNYSHHAMHYSLMTYLFYNWKIVPRDPLLSSPQVSSPLATTNLSSLPISQVLFSLFFQFPHASEITWYLSFCCCKWQDLFIFLWLSNVCTCAQSLQSCSTLQPYALQPARLLCPWDSPGKNTEVGCRALLQGIFLIQGSNLCLLSLLHWQADSLSTEPPGKPLSLGSHMLLLVFLLTPKTKQLQA